MSRKDDVEYWVRISDIRRQAMLKATREYEESLEALNLARSLRKAKDSRYSQKKASA